MGSITAVESPLEHVPLWIDNKPERSPADFEVRNSTSQQVVWTVAGADATLAKKVVDSASKAFPAWSRTHPAERRRIFFQAAKLMRERQEEIINVMVQETNCTAEWAAGININFSAACLEELGSLATTCVTGALPTTQNEDRLALVFKEPYGVVLGIAPWNAALNLAIRAVATPIICGNTAILKASELSPRTHHLIGVIFRDAGLPDGVLNIVQHSRENGPEVLEALIGHPAVRKINFTGSTAVGKIIARTSGSYLKPVLMELGGKSSCIVLEDANLSKAAKAVVMGGFLNHGQVCMATERVIVMRSVAEDFRLALIKEAQAFGSAGSAVTTAGARKTEQLVASAVSQGARLEYGSLKLVDAGLSPTIVSGVTKEMDLFYAESFGPTVSLMIVETVDEAVALANDTDYGLSTSIFSKNTAKAVRLARRIETGACHINAMTIHDEPLIPHGGCKKSGFGRFNAHWGLDEFLQAKAVTITDDDSD